MPSATVAAATRPFAAIPEARRRQALTIVVALAAFLFPIYHGNQADIDSVANAAIYASLALGLNIVVGFAGLLDLGYAAFFAIGAYTYGILSSFQLQPEWSSFWVPFQELGLVAQMPGESSGLVVHFTLSFWLAMPLAALVAAGCGVAFGAAHLAAPGRLSRDRHPRLRRNRADRGRATGPA